MRETGGEDDVYGPDIRPVPRGETPGDGLGMACVDDAEIRIDFGEGSYLDVYTVSVSFSAWVRGRR